MGVFFIIFLHLSKMLKCSFSSSERGEIFLSSISSFCLLLNLIFDPLNMKLMIFLLFDLQIPFRFKKSSILDLNSCSFVILLVCVDCVDCVECVECVDCVDCVDCTLFVSSEIIELCIEAFTSESKTFDVMFPIILISTSVD